MQEIQEVYKACCKFVIKVCKTTGSLENITVHAILGSPWQEIEVRRDNIKSKKFLVIVLVSTFHDEED